MSPRSGTEEAAHQYADAGWSVFPCIPGEKTPATGHGFHEATADHRQIQSWWGRNPDRNLAIATGAPGPDVLDIDRHGNQSGFPALRQLKEAGLVGEPGAMVRTPSGGAHLYFAGTEHQRNGHIEAAHVDFRSNGGYVVAPPSQVNGRPYAVVSHQPSSDTFDWAAAKQHLEPERTARREWTPSPDAGPRNLDHLVRYVGECSDHVNDRLYWAACRMAEAGQLDRLPDLVQAAYAAGEDRRGQAEKTVESALRTVNRSEPQREAG
ncbi:MAG: bifunctional DNA primase/polymerase [Streptosporangiaceae bacterium]